MPALPIVYRRDYEMDIGSHVFQMEKYRMALELLLAEGYADPSAILAPEPATPEQLLTTHTAAYLDDFEALRWTGRTASSELPLSREIVEGFKLMAGGTILAARTALEKGLALHLGGGFHHAFADHAEGFCYINDIAVAIRVLRGEGKIGRAAVIDVDLHQGNGTAHIFKDDPETFTFSIHQQHLYPEKQTSTVDIGLDFFAGDEVYLRELARIIPSHLEKHRPDLVVYVAGADPYEQDQLGDLRLTLDGLKRRDRIAAEACRAHGWPMATVLAGGYARDKRDTARIHANTGVEMARAWGIAPRAS